MKRTPEINSYWDEAAQEVVYKHYVNLGIAAATPRGLVVPNVKDADALSMTELAQALGELTATAREGRTQPAEMAGGTFTITNVGVFGGLVGLPIINQPQAAILGIGTIVKRPVVINDAIAIRPIVYVSLSYDHRIVDGADAARFLTVIKRELEKPAQA
jgi:pyruvate dehydrogenase E2 component (dihydrolipoamide acetyltransferase)